MVNVTYDDVEISHKESMHKASRQPTLGVEFLVHTTQDVTVKSSDLHVHVIALRPKEA